MINYFNKEIYMEANFCHSEEKIHNYKEIFQNDDVIS